MGRRMRTAMATGAILAGTAAPALAQTGREDSSGIFVWAFLGLCALIVAAQLVPAVLMMIGAAKGVARGIREYERKPAEGRVSGER